MPRKPEPEIKRQQPPQRRSAHACLLTLLPHTVLPGDPRHQFLGYQPPVGPGLAAAHLPIAFMRVLCQPPITGVVDPHNYQRLYFARLDCLVRMLAYLPRSPRHKRYPPVEEILSILQIKHRVRSLRMPVIFRGQVDDHVAIIRQIPALKPAMKPQPRVPRTEE